MPVSSWAETKAGISLRIVDDGARVRRWHTRNQGGLGLGQHARAAAPWSAAHRHRLSTVGRHSGSTSTSQLSAAGPGSHMVSPERRLATLAGVADMMVARPTRPVRAPTEAARVSSWPTITGYSGRRPALRRLLQPGCDVVGAVADGRAPCSRRRRKAFDPTSSCSRSPCRCSTDSTPPDSSRAS